MIQDFMDSWPLFQYAYLTGWLIGMSLSLVGVLVVAREQIFLSAAVTQASTLGMALGLWLGGFITAPGLAWLHSDTFLSSMAVVFAAISALIAGRAPEPGRETSEAITGWIFLISASLAILLLSHNPHGLDEIYRLLSSSIIGAAPTDVWIFAVLLTGSAALLAAFHRPILLLTLDPGMAAAVGLRVGAWTAAIAIWLGLAAGLSLRVSGMLYTFGCLVLPALIAKNTCREVRAMFVAAPLFALAACVAGSLLANHYDYPPAQLTVALMGLLVAGSWGFRRLRRYWNP